MPYSDPNYLVWVAQYLELVDGIVRHKGQPIPLRQCTDADLEKLMKKDYEKAGFIQAKMKDMFCLDKEKMKEVVFGNTKIDAKWRAVDVKAVPCANLTPESNAADSSSRNSKCNTDK